MEILGRMFSLLFATASSLAGGGLMVVVQHCWTNDIHFLSIGCFVVATFLFIAGAAYMSHALFGED